MSALFPKHAVIDDAFPAELADAILARALESEDQFIPTKVSEGTLNDTYRKSLVHEGGLGELSKPFRKAVKGLFPDLCKGAGVRPFEVGGLEIQLVAHRDGHFYKTHSDTFVKNRDRAEAKLVDNRILSLVTYFFRQPAGFTGGETVLYPFGGEGELPVTPRHNRALAFPSIAPHSVNAISVPGNAWEDARFSVNCWFRVADTKKS